VPKSSGEEDDGVEPLECSPDLCTYGTCKDTVGRRIFGVHGAGQVAISTNGNVVASAGDTVRFWDQASGELSVEYAPDHRVDSFALAPSGTRFAVGLDEQDDMVLVLDVPDLSEHRRWVDPVGSTVHALAYGPNGDLVAMGGRARVVVADIDTGDILHMLDNEGENLARVLEFSPEGNTLAVGYAPATTGVVLLDIESGEDRLLEPKYLYMDITDLAFSGDGSLLGAFDESDYTVWDVATGARVLDPDEPTEPGDGGRMAFSPDGSVLAITGPTLTFVDPMDGSVLAEVEDAWAGDVVFHPCGHGVVTVGGYAVASLGLEGGTAEGLSPREPENHRPEAESCGEGEPPVDPPETSCTTAADCTASPDAICNEYGACLYPECYEDEHCDGTVCQCAIDGQPSRCARAGDCRVDADCGSDGYCSPAENNRGCGYDLHGYFCHTPYDECIDDSDCLEDYGWFCTYFEAAERWAGSHASCAESRPAGSSETRM